MAMEPKRPPTPVPDGPHAGGGRPRHFEGPTVRLNLQIPLETAKLIRHLAVDRGVSPSQIIHEWAGRREAGVEVPPAPEGTRKDTEADRKRLEDELAWWDEGGKPLGPG